ncbi:MAG: 30S ribosomal protein S8 [Candidatus Omnitrophota bacterium]
MSVTDPIADMATQIRNASSAGKVKVDVKASKVKEAILKILKEEGFIENYKRMPDNKQDTLRIYLKFSEGKKPYMKNIKRISKPGLRVYKGNEELFPVLGGLGISIVSSSEGIITDRVAKEKNLGGEVLLEVW